MDYVPVEVWAASFIGMEFIARGMHKYLMHGPLWPLHEDHHRPTNSPLQKNDAFASIFAVVSAGLVVHWLISGDLISLSVAVGMASYGAAYLFIHDMVIHNRHAKLRKWGSRNRYLNAMIRVHDLHHSRGKGNWGFLLIIPGLDEIPRRTIQGSTS